MAYYSWNSGENITFPGRSDRDHIKDEPAAKREIYCRKHLQLER